MTELWELYSDSDTEDIEEMLENDNRIIGIYFYMDYESSSQEDILSFVEGVYGTCDSCFSAELIFEEEGAGLYFYSRNITDDPLTAVNAINEAKSVASVLDVLGDFYIAEKAEDVYEDLVQEIEEYGSEFTLSIETDSMIQLPRDYEFSILVNDLGVSTMCAIYCQDNSVYIAQAEVQVNLGSQQDTYDGYVLIAGVDDAWRVLFLDSDGNSDIYFFRDYLE